MFRNISAVFLICFGAHEAPAESRLRSLEQCIFESQGESIEAECGVLEVPETHFGVSESTIELPFVRFACTGTQKRTTVVHLVGGPGSSGIATGKTRYHIIQALREVADVILLDQRGTGDAVPNLAVDLRWNYPLDEPGSETRWNAIGSARGAEARAILEARGINLDHYNTRESAADVDALRKALRLEGISLWGTSYGTHLSLAVIRYHGEHVDRAILAGVEGPDHTYKLPSTLERYWHHVAELMRSNPDIAAALPDPTAVLGELLDALEEEPVRAVIRGEQTVVIGRYDLQAFVANSIGRRNSLAVLPRELIELRDGNYRRLAARVLREREAFVGNAMGWAMDCASSASAGRLERIKREAGSTLLGNAVNRFMREACAGWDVPDLGEEFRSPLQSEVPVLFMSGSLDSRTPESNAREIQKGFPNSYHVLVRNTGHDDVLFSHAPGLGDRMVSFIRGEEVSEEPIVADPIEWARLR